jgi:hypothetical protein
LTKVGYPRTQNPHKYWVCGHSVYGQKRFKKVGRKPKLNTKVGYPLNIFHTFAQIFQSLPVFIFPKVGGN